MVLNGKRQELRIAGIVLSPEFIFESRPGAALPDNRTYGIFWMGYKELASAFDLDGAFNYLTLTLAPGAPERPIIAALERLLTPYGGRNAYGRGDHPSHIRVSDEIRVLQILSVGFPIVFLSVAAFMTNAVLSRLLALQREQIAILKAFGFTNRQIVTHYLNYALVMVAGGTVMGGFVESIRPYAPRSINARSVGSSSRHRPKTSAGAAESRPMMSSFENVMPNALE
jgi:putative ABC transport system permease protein